MKLYRFYLHTGKEVEILKDVLEVEEKPKTYIKKNHIGFTRILKSEVGVLSGYDNNTLCLLEDDMEKVRSIFAESLKRKIKSENRKINVCREEIAKYEKGIELLKGEEG